MRKHALDWFSLLAGLVFVIVAVVHLVAASTTHDTDVRWGPRSRWCWSGWAA